MSENGNEEALREMVAGMRHRLAIATAGRDFHMTHESMRRLQAEEDARRQALLEEARMGLHEKRAAAKRARKQARERALVEQGRAEERAENEKRQDECAKAILLWIGIVCLMVFLLVRVIKSNSP